MKRFVTPVLAAIVLFGLAPGTAGAQTEAVSLSASASRVAYGTAVVLSGAVSPAAPGLAVEISDALDTAVATATTDAAGAFSVSLTPEGTATYVASWGSVSSEPVTVRVRAVVTARASPVRLFGVLRIRGSVLPARPGEPVEVVLIRQGRVVASRDVRQGPAGGFAARFRVMEPGRYRARASFVAADLLRGSDAVGPSTTPLPRLREGSTGIFVRLLEQRLVELRYRLAGSRDGRYDHRTADAVVAFHKVQRMARTFVVDAATWRALADPVVPRPRSDGGDFRFEVDQTRQVLYTVEGGTITNILHVSTGAGGATRDGTFRVYRKLAGYSPNRLYYPSYFDGLRALHGWTEVPTYPASHGCIRIPYWNARWVFRLAEYGTRVVIYH